MLKDGKVFKKCIGCLEIKEVSEENFSKTTQGNKICSWCKPCKLVADQSWRKKIKILCSEYRGGKCVVCGYDKCLSAIDFHHTDPTQKEYTISRYRSFDDKIKKELDKCIPLCKNCHTEFHDGLLSLDEFIVEDKKC